jgi:hypothetical protein
MDKDTDTDDNEGNKEEKGDKGKKQGPKRKKTEHLPIHKTEIIEPDVVPEGSTFKGYRDVVVQDLVIQLDFCSDLRSIFPSFEGLSPVEYLETTWAIWRVLLPKSSRSSTR